MLKLKDRRKKRRTDITVGLAVMVCTTAIGTSTIASSVRERTIVNDDYASLTAGVAKYLNSSNIDSIKKESSIKCIEYQKTMLSSFEESTTVATETESEDDLYWLSRVISAEVGNSTYENKAMCGLVVVNRVNSPSFKAETVEEVIFSPGQYETVSNGKIYDEPDEESVEIARKILAGTIEIEIPADVVYQAEFRQGSGIYCQIGNEYYCFDD